MTLARKGHRPNHQSPLRPKIADWEPRDIERSISVQSGEVKYLKLDVRYNLNEMNLGQPKASYLIYLTPMRAEDAQYEIRNTDPVP